MIGSDAHDLSPRGDPFAGTQPTRSTPCGLPVSSLTSQRPTEVFKACAKPKRRRLRRGRHRPDCLPLVPEPRNRLYGHFIGDYLGDQKAKSPAMRSFPRTWIGEGGIRTHDTDNRTNAWLRWAPIKCA